VSQITEKHILEFIQAKTDGSTRPLLASTLQNILSVLRRVLELAVEEGHVERNPCRNLGKLLAKVKRRQSTEVQKVGG
jgi:DNA-binding GntR family transcriptional regulator